MVTMETFVPEFVKDITAKRTQDEFAGRLEDPKPLYIVVEGADGSGKDTQIDLITSYLRGLGRSVATTRTPTRRDGKNVYATAVGKWLDERFKDGVALWPDDIQRALALGGAFFADMAMHDADFVVNRLASGIDVVQSRSWLSTASYQSVSKQIREGAAQLGARMTTPDLTIYLDLPIEECLARIKARGAVQGGGDIFEREDRLRRTVAAFHENMNRLWLHADHGWLVTVDARGRRSQVFGRVLTELGRV